MKKFMVVAALLLFCGVAQAAVTYTYTLTFSAVADADEGGAATCTLSVNDGSAITLGTDCEINTDGAESISIWYDSTATANTTASWSLNVRGIAAPGGSYPALATDPTDATYYEATGLADGQYGFYALTPSPYAIKIRVDEDAGGGAVLAVTVKVRVVK